MKRERRLITDEDLRFFPVLDYMDTDGKPKYKVGAGYYLCSYISQVGVYTEVKAIVSDNIHSLVVMHIKQERLCNGYTQAMKLVNDINSGKIKVSRDEY